MSRCKECNEWTGFLGGTTCKECEKKKLDEWVKQHTFVRGEKVRTVPDDFDIKGRIGIVVEKGEDIIGAWGYYCSSEWYKVKIKGIIYKLPTHFLEKIKE